jgi:hypothetical protein
VRTRGIRPGTYYVARDGGSELGKAVRSVKRRGRMTVIACGTVLTVVGAAATLDAVLTDGAAGPDSGHSAPTGSAVTTEAEDVLGRLERAGLPVERPTVFTSETDPDHLLGHADGYRSKAAFEDNRVDGGLVADNDPGSVAMGGLIEVFGDTRAARRRAEQLQREALGIPTRAERGYVVRGVLLRLSPYLKAGQAEEYRRVLGARAIPTPSPSPDIRQV